MRRICSCSFGCCLTVSSQKWTVRPGRSFVQMGRHQSTASACRVPLWRERAWEERIIELPDHTMPYLCMYVCMYVCMYKRSP